MKSLLFSIVFFSRVLVVFSRPYLLNFTVTFPGLIPSLFPRHPILTILGIMSISSGRSKVVLDKVDFSSMFSSSYSSFIKKKTSNSTLTFLVLLNFDCVIKGMRDLFFTRIYSTDKGFSCHLEALNSFLWLLFNLSVFFLNSSYFIVMGKKISSISNVFQISYHR